MTLGTHISTLRRRMGITQSELAKIIGISGASLCTYEQDGLSKPIDAEILSRLADALDAPELLAHACSICPTRLAFLSRRFPELVSSQGADLTDRIRASLASALDSLDSTGTSPESLAKIVAARQAIETLEYSVLIQQAQVA